MNLISLQLHITGMTCVNCQNKIEKKLRKTAGITAAAVSFAKGTAEITYDTEVISLEQVIDVIENLGYEVPKAPGKKHTDIIRTVCLLAVILLLYLILQWSGLLNMLVPSQLADTGMGYGMLFVVGLLTSVHCIAMCGGINLTQCLPKEAAPVQGGSKLDTFRPALLYNLGRVISYTVIGFILGFIGMVIGGSSGTGLSAAAQGILKLIAGFFMVIMGINMLGIFPWLRRLNLRMPGFVAARVGRRKAKSRQPLLIGLLNGLMPCGPLQSMQIVALACGNPFAGALSMLLFSLGTVPLMLGLGSAVSALGKKFSQKVMGAGAVLVVVLGLAMLSQGSALAGLPFPGSGIPPSPKEEDAGEAGLTDGVQNIRSTLSLGRYPNITVQAGIPVKWVIDAPAGSINGCNRIMLIREYGIEHEFQEGENIIEFTPETTGTYVYTCWMGMIFGTIQVVDGDGATIEEAAAEAEAETSEGITLPVGSPGSCCAP